MTSTANLAVDWQRRSIDGTREQHFAATADHAVTLQVTTHLHGATVWAATYWPEAAGSEPVSVEGTAVDVDRGKAAAVLAGWGMLQRFEAAA